MVDRPSDTILLIRPDGRVERMDRAAVDQIFLPYHPQILIRGDTERRRRPRRSNDHWRGRLVDFRS